MFKIIKNGTEPKFEAVEPEQVYEVQYFKKAIDKEGVEVEVVDDQRREHLTATQLEAQKVSLQAQIKEIDSKLAEIAKL